MESLTKNDHLSVYWILLDCLYADW